MRGRRINLGAQNYLNNPLIHADRRTKFEGSSWRAQFDCSHLRPLIICRGPIRKEVMDVFDEMGIDSYGILLSERDSVVYRGALAPELRILTDHNRVHRVPDYSGATKEERDKRIVDIIDIAERNGYDAIFAGYGFMAEDERMVAAMESAGLIFIGPCSRTVRQAGLKDEAKRTALRAGVSVTPGIDNATTLTLLKKYPDRSALISVCEEHGLELEYIDSEDGGLDRLAEEVLEASYRKGVDLYSIEELGETLKEAVVQMNEQYPENRFRLKAIGGGGGKGQRIVPLGEADRTPELVREVLSEVKATGVGDNKNVLVELNIETTRHQEIQVLGNGEWCITLGGRDCSLQMHEQKLLEVSVTRESLLAAEQRARQNGAEKEAAVLSQDVATLDAMEAEAIRFGEAVGLDSVSTFECIVDREKHFFMEMNTRIQVEHRVSELCYAMRFSNPNNSTDSFIVESLVEAMVLLAVHGERLPKPARIQRLADSLEARLNATNDALKPNAGGIVEFWSDPIEGEIRDDQGISLRNPDTGTFMNYTLAGAYDSNIALLLTSGDSRETTYEKMAEVLRSTHLGGRSLQTNLAFHYGLVHWFLGRTVNARPTTGFIMPYLTAVGELARESVRVDIDLAWNQLCSNRVAASGSEAAELRSVLAAKQSLLIRPIKQLMLSPHFFSGWLSLNQKAFRFEGRRLEWTKNPIELLVDTYHFLRLDWNENLPAANMIWDHDYKILSDAQDFYSSLNDRFGWSDWRSTCDRLAGEAPDGIESIDWVAIRAAHKGFQAGTEILGILPAMAQFTQFFGLAVNLDMSIEYPKCLLDHKHQKEMAKELAPPPVANSNEIVADSGGMFYGREAPNQPLYVEPGEHFEAGQPLYIIEVMKMFNKVLAPFSGTIDEVLIDGDGVIITKGQPLFRVTPDEGIDLPLESDVVAIRKSHTMELMELFL